TARSIAISSEHPTASAEKVTRTAQPRARYAAPKPPAAASTTCRPLRNHRESDSARERIHRPSTAATPPDTTAAATALTKSMSGERLQHVDHGRAEQHDEQYGPDARQKREDHLDGHLLGVLLRALAALEPHLAGLGPQDVRYG